MTRINANIPPAKLTDQHLRAEHREIVRVCGKYVKRLAKGDAHIHQSHSFCMGTGHELFFVDKGLFTLERYKSLHAECLKRGFNESNYESAWDVYEQRHLKWHDFTDAENQLIIDRITTRLKDSRQIPRYDKQDITVEQAIELISCTQPPTEGLNS